MEQQELIAAFAGRFCSLFSMLVAFFLVINQRVEILNVDAVVCAKNRAVSLGAVLRRIREEIPFKNLIVVYGSSIDGTKEVAQKFTENVFWDEDEGLGAARNLGVKKASSEIVAMIDTDVILTKGWYQQLIRHFEDPEAAAVIGTCIYGYGCKPLESYWDYLRKTDTVNFGCHNAMFRRQILLRIGNFDRTIRGAGEDYDLYRRLLAAGYKWVWDKEAEVYHPMSLFEYLHHVRWWAQGRPRIQEIMSVGLNRSLVRIYGSQAFLVFEAFAKSFRLAIRVHPIMLLYYPMIRLTFFVTTLQEIRKLREQSQN